MRAASFIAVATSSEDSLSAWLRLSETLGLTGANVDERRTTSSGHEAWSGVVEHVHQDAQQRHLLLRLDSPFSGAALVGTYSSGTGTIVSLCRYFYGDDAAHLAAESEPPWREWLTRTFEREGAAASRP
jgi:hypothetical protein